MTAATEPDAKLVEFVGGFLRAFGGGIRARLRVSAGECTLTFPESPPAPLKRALPNTPRQESRR